MPTRVLAITSELPWPLDTGGHQRSFHLLAALAGAGFEVTTLAPVAGPDEAAGRALRAAGIQVRPVVVGPRTLPGEAGKAARALIAGEPYAFYRRHHWRKVQAEVEAMTAAGVVDVLYLDHLDSFAYVGRHPLPMALDMHNVYSTLLGRAADAAGPGRRAALRTEARRLARVEVRAVAAVDVTFAVSKADAEVFAARGARRVVTVPNGVDTEALAALPVGRPSTAAPVLLFVGALAWGPNEDACRRLVLEVLPKVRERTPAAEVHLVGRSPSPTVLALAAAPGVRIFGDVPDVRPHLETASALVVPLTVGGGTRLKILEAFAAGLPVVSTAVGAEGIACHHDRHLLIADVDHLAESVGCLLAAPALGGRLAAEARRLVAATYDWSIVGRTAAEALADLVRARSSR